MIINYSNCIINLDKLQYVLVARYEYNYEKRWKVQVMMGDGKEFHWKGYKTEVEAQAKMEDFFQAIERTQYQISELTL